MNFRYSRHNLRGKQKNLERLFEIVPGFFSWTILIGMIVLSFCRPLIAAVIIIAFDLYWLLRLIYMNIFLVLSYGRLTLDEQIDWMDRVEKLKDLDSCLENLRENFKSLSLKKRVSLLIHKNEIKALKKAKAPMLHLDEIYQLVIIPIVKETPDIVEPGIAGIAEGKFPSKRILVIMAVEDRASDEIKEGAKEIAKKHQSKFLDLFIALHPNGISGEAKVKAANATFAAKQAAQIFEKKKIPFENVIVSCFDADTVISPEYFSCLTYHYMISPDRNQASFQPIPVYHNNIWKAPAFARVLDIGSSFFQLIEATNPEQLITFSSHSMSFKALVDIDYWPVDIISDDSAIFWKALIHFNGKYRVVPMYVTLSMDVTEAESWWRTAVNVYKQKRRWAWGVENFPIVMRAFLKSKEISSFQKFKHGFKLLEAHISWATWPFLLSVIGWLPAIFSSKEYHRSIFYYSSPRIAGTIFSLASIGLAICIILSLLLLPKKKVKHGILKRIAHAFEWLLIPPITIFLSAVPALDAQTRLMLGKYMEFWVTVKKR